MSASILEHFAPLEHAVAQLTDGDVIAANGKSAHAARDRKRGRGPLHRVSAWASANRLVLGQEATDAKSSEIMGQSPSCWNCWSCADAW